jgi:uncharacterized membrane protein
MVNNIPTGDPLSEHEQAARRLCHLIYALQALAFFAGITAFIGAFLNHLKSEDVRGTLAESHFRWQIRTFWWGMLWVLVGVFTYYIGVGLLLLSLIPLWFIYRIIKGWLRLNAGRAMYV